MTRDPRATLGRKRAGLHGLGQFCVVVEKEHPRRRASESDQRLSQASVHSTVTAKDQRRLAVTVWV